MKQYIMDINKTLELLNYDWVIEANNKQEAIKKYNELGFNSGFRLSSTWKPTNKKLTLKDLELYKGKTKLMEC